MATWKAAVCLAALLASTTVYAKPSSPAGRNRPQQAATNAETYCKVSALVSHDAILARLNDEKPDDTKTHLPQSANKHAACWTAPSILPSAKPGVSTCLRTPRPYLTQILKNKLPNALAWKSITSA